MMMMRRVLTRVETRNSSLSLARTIITVIIIVISRQVLSMGASSWSFARLSRISMPPPIRNLARLDRMFTMGVGVGLVKSISISNNLRMCLIKKAVFREQQVCMGVTVLQTISQ
jgi:hypothetical protein